VTTRAVEIVLVFVIVIAAGSCGGGSPSSRNDHEGQTTVDAAFYPLAWAAERVGDGAVEVHNLTRPGTEPHDVELTPKDVADIRSADVVLYLGSGFQPAVEQAVDGADGKTVDLLRGGPLLRPAEAEGALTADPHIWLDPIRYSRIVRTIARTLGRPHADVALVAKLRALDFAFRTGLAHCNRRDIVTTHAAFGYLARRYGLKQIPLSGLSPEAEPAPKDLQRIVSQVRNSGATTIFFETLVSPRLAQTVARETGTKTAVLNPIEGLTEDEVRQGEDYFSVMRENLASLRGALGCR
jgi:zinc transport system substrate-binding protein